MPSLAVLCCIAGGCFHSDARRSGYTERGRFWSERVADRIDEPHLAELTDEIVALGADGEVDRGEARVLAETATRYAAELARSYRMVEPIEVHNTLVNLGLRKRGLCYQCAEDLYARLRQIEMKTLRLHWGVAHKDDMWLEHSGVIVTARGRPFETGLVLDGWRHAGRLRWAKVDADRYPWVKMYKRKFPETRFEEIDAPPGVDDANLAGHTEPPSDQRVERRAAATRGGERSPAGGATSRGQLSAIVTSRDRPR